MERGSVIDAQITYNEEVAKEVERCKDPIYFYYNYWSHPIYGKQAKAAYNRFNRQVHEAFAEMTKPRSRFYV